MSRALILVALVVPLCAFGQAKARTPDAGTRTLPEVRPPLGRLGAVVDPLEPGGVPAGELAVRAQFAGCPEPHVYYLSRALLLGAAGAGEQLSQWLDAQPALKRKLYGKGHDRLAEAVKKARRGTFAEGRACRAKDGKFPDVPLFEGAKLNAQKAPPALCKLERGNADQGGVWLFTRADSKNAKVAQRDFTGAVLFLPPEQGAKKPCLPRLSVALFDDAGVTRLRYHADYNGALEVELPGDRCTRVLFSFDEARQVFVPKVDRDPACPAKRPRTK